MKNKVQNIVRQAVSTKTSLLRRLMRQVTCSFMRYDTLNAGLAGGPALVDQLLLPGIAEPKKWEFGSTR